MEKYHLWSDEHIPKGQLPPDKSASCYNSLSGVSEWVIEWVWASIKLWDKENYIRLFNDSMQVTKKTFNCSTSYEKKINSLYYINLIVSTFGNFSNNQQCQQCCNAIPSQPITFQHFVMSPLRYLRTPSVPFGVTRLSAQQVPWHIFKYFSSISTSSVSLIKGPVWKI